MLRVFALLDRWRGTTAASGVNAALISAAAVVFAVLISAALSPWIGTAFPFVTLFGAVLIATWVGDWRFGVAAALTGYVAAALLFTEPNGAIDLGIWRNLVGLVAYLFTCMLLIAVAEVARSSGDRLFEERAKIRATLLSIGDGLISTDAGSVITEINRTAQCLTGWSRADAVGQPLGRIFNIVNEESRQPVTNPVEKAIATGQIVGLANHTVLIAKDGAERPIDDSAAPIVLPSGQLVGCVLVFRDISERKQLEESLQLADRRKDEFLATLAHELRNPLQPISTCLGILKHQALEDQVPVVTMMTRNVAQLVRLVDDLLDAGRITTGKLVLRQVRMDLCVAVRHALETHRDGIAAKGLQVTLQEPPAIFVHGDQFRLVQVFSNLLSNACKFTVSGGRIDIAVSTESGHAIVRVTDTGVGIEETDQARIFEMFTQAKGSTPQTPVITDGLGIGLALARQIVDLHHGTLRVESLGTGHGSSFVVSLPRID